MKTVLITGIGGDIAQGVATIIREQRPDFRLIGVDMHEQHGGALFVDEFAKIPPASAAEYPETVRKLLKEKDVDVIIPLSEQELEVIGPLALELGKNRCITSGERAVAVGLDKLATINALSGFGLPVPWTVTVAEGVPSEYPCILKSRFGSGSRTVFIVKDSEEAAYLVKRYPDAIFQEMLEPADREVTCAVYRSRDGEVASLLMLRRLAGGFTSWAKVIEDEKTSHMCQVIAQGLDLRGSMNVQLRLTDEGPRVFEINPRFSSTVLMRHRVGFRDVMWALDEAEEKAVSFSGIQHDRHMVRTQGALVF